MIMVLMEKVWKRTKCEKCKSVKKDYYVQKEGGKLIVKTFYKEGN